MTELDVVYATCPSCGHQAGTQKASGLKIRCPRCIARSFILRTAPGPLLLILQHEPGCVWMTAFAAKAPQ